MIVRRSPSLFALIALASVVITGCGGNTNDAADSSATEADTVAGNLQVFAAASLTEAFTELGRSFETAHPDAIVTFTFAGSSALAQQVNEGGPADVFVSADESSMRIVTDTGSALNPRIIARNRLALLVERGNPKGIRGLADLARSGVLFVLCAPEIPCGRLSVAALQAADVTTRPASLEASVKAVVSKVTLGEADAGIVYVTDVKAAADKAQGVDMDISSNPMIEAAYPIAVTKQASNRTVAKAWVDFVLSDDGQRTLAMFGFLAP